MRSSTTDGTKLGFAVGYQLWLVVAVCALGYFVDIYDLILFSIVRVESLKDIGVSASQILPASELILNSQMAGMLLGGLLFGVLADKRGRMGVLLGSILLYSIMNIINAFVSSVPAYAVMRFFSGIGLAGELGVAITLVSEVMPSKSRGLGTTIVASTGILGAVAAYAVHSTFNWRMAFIAGGVLGLLLLVMRVRLHDSGMFHRTKEQDVPRGSLRMLFSRKRIVPYLSAIAIGMPTWYIIGVLVTFSPEFARERGSTELVIGGLGVMWAYVGLVAGDLASGLASQLLRSRKAVILLFLILIATTVWWYLTSEALSANTVYFQCGLLGFAGGYWAVFVTTAAEQFGTNLRATVATTVPNFVRGALVPILMLFHQFRDALPVSTAWLGLTNRTLASSAALVGIVVLVVALTGWISLRETFGKNLDYHES